LDPSQGCGKTIEGTSTDPTEIAEKERMEQNFDEAAARKSKAQAREGEVKGQWWPCTATEEELRSMGAEGFLQPGS
jgi:hypothetical protein